MNPNDRNAQDPQHKDRNQPSRSPGRDDDQDESRQGQGSQREDRDFPTEVEDQRFPSADEQKRSVSSDDED